MAMIGALDASSDSEALKKTSFFSLPSICKRRFFELSKKLRLRVTRSFGSAGAVVAQTKSFVFNACSSSFVSGKKEAVCASSPIPRTTTSSSRKCFSKLASRASRLSFALLASVLSPKNAAPFAAFCSKLSLISRSLLCSLLTATQRSSTKVTLGNRN